MLKVAGVQAVLALASRRIQRNSYFLLKFCILIGALVIVYALLFDVFMAMEGRDFSFVSGLYWSLTTMSTLGYGDITFSTDAGRAFSLFVLLSGMILMLVLLPFIIIEFVYTPIMQAQEAARTPRSLPQTEAKHVLLTNYDAVSQALVERLERHGTGYAVIVPDMKEALALQDFGVRVIVGDIDSPDTYRNAGVDRASLVATTTENDALNTNVVFTVRQVCETVPIVSLATNPESVDILEFAGANQVLRMSEMMGATLARCATGGGANAHILGQLGGVLMVESRVHGMPWIGHTLAELSSSDRLGVNVAGIWERGQFEVAGPQSLITENSVLFMGMAPDQLDRYNALVGDGHEESGNVIIVGGGSVGRAAARSLKSRGITFRLVEKLAIDHELGDGIVVSGDAADLSVLREAGIESAGSVIITTHDDHTNIYFTIYCRSLRPDIQIITRATHERNVTTLHRAGADFVYSDATMGANAIFNHLRHGTTLMLVEGLFATRVRIPPGLRGRTLAEAGVRARTGCSVVSIEKDGRLIVNPGPNIALPQEGHMVVIETPASEQRFLDAFGSAG